MPEPLDYLRDGARIYERSFAIIRTEADLSRFSAEEADIVVRMVHACGCVEITSRIAFGRDLIGSARAALARGAPILCDSEMVAHGVTRARLPAHNDVICTLRDARVATLAEKLCTTRSAAALDLWHDRLAGAVVAIGNAPTALFRLLEMLDAGAASRSGRWKRRRAIRAGSCSTPARRNRPRSSVSRWDSSVRRKRRTHWRGTRAACHTSPCGDAWAEAQ